MQLTTSVLECCPGCGACVRPGCTHEAEVMVQASDGAGYSASTFACTLHTPFGESKALLMVAARLFEEHGLGLDEAGVGLGRRASGARFIEAGRSPGRDAGAIVRRLETLEAELAELRDAHLELAANHSSLGRTVQARTEHLA